MMRMTTSRVFVLLAALIFATAARASAAEHQPLPDRLPARLDFNRDIRPVVSAKCFPCHGPDAGARMAGLRLDQREQALKDRGGVRAITPGKPAASRVYLRISAREPAQRMPPS